MKTKLELNRQVHIWEHPRINKVRSTMGIGYSVLRWDYKLYLEARSGRIVYTAYWRIFRLYERLTEAVAPVEEIYSRGFCKIRHLVNICKELE